MKRKWNLQTSLADCQKNRPVDRSSCIRPTIRRVGPGKIWKKILKKGSWLSLPRFIQCYFVFNTFLINFKCRLFSNKWTICFSQNYSEESRFKILSPEKYRTFKPVWKCRRWVWLGRRCRRGGTWCTLPACGLSWSSGPRPWQGRRTRCRRRSWAPDLTSKTNRPL